MRFEEVLERFEVKCRLKEDSYQCTCPSHSDRNASLTISQKDKTIVMKCHAGCHTLDILSKVGLEYMDLYENKEMYRQEMSKWNRVEEHYKQILKPYTDVVIADKYLYCDENKKPLYYRIRYEYKDESGNKQKTIRPMHFESGKPIYSMGNIKPVLYNLPNILRAIKQGYPIYITEGEKDVETLKAYGYAATTSGGATSWKKEFNKYFVGAQVVILPDNDEAGSEFAHHVRKELKKYAHSIKIVITSQMPKGDVTDYFNEGHTIQQFQNLIDNTECIYAPWIYQRGNQLHVNGGILASVIRSHIDYIILKKQGKDNAQFYMYENGVYKPTDNMELAGYIKRYIPAHLLKMQIVDNVCKDIRSDIDAIRSFDSTDNDSNLINYKNGLYNIKEKRLEAHTPKYISLNQLNVDYNEMPKNTGHWDRYINTLVRGDKQILQVLQEYAGLTLSNIPGYMPKKSLLLYGKGNTGKSKYLSVLNEMIGEENGINIAISKLGDRFALADAHGKRLIFNGDLNKGEFGDISTFKEVTGGDSVRAEPKGQAAFSFLFNGVCIYVCNDKPNIIGDIGIHVFDRFLLVRCDNVIPEGERDRNLMQKLLVEKEYIAKWALEGLERLIANGYNFTYSEKIQREVDEYRKESNSLLAFVSSQCLIEENSTLRIRCSEFHSVYKRWCQENEIRSISPREIANVLSELGVEKKKSNYEYYYGIMLEA